MLFDVHNLLASGLAITKMSLAAMVTGPWTDTSGAMSADRRLIADSARMRADARRTLMTIFAQFDECHMISLPERGDRRRRVAGQLARLGLDFDMLGIRLFDAHRFDDADGFPSKGVRGCFNSHLALARRAADTGRTILVLEDDIRFDIAALARFDDHAMTLSGQPWDLLYLGRLSRDRHRGGGLRRAPEQTIGGHCYAIRPQFATAIATFMEQARQRPAGDPRGGRMYRDGAFNFFRARHPEWLTMTTGEPLAGQQSSRSDLTPRRRDRVMIARHCVAAARRLREAVA